MALFTGYTPTLSPQPCGAQGLRLSQQGLGCLPLTADDYHSGGSAPRPDDAAGVILRALELGVSCLDTAADWGPFDNERLIGRTLRGMVQKPTVMTQWGPLGRVPAYARRTLEAQLQRLDVDAIDLWILRGFNEEQCSVQEAMATIKVLVEEGKVKYVGLANCTADQLRRAHAVHPVTAVEVEWSLCARHNEADIIPAARALGVGIIAWGPLGNGALTERWQTRDDMPPLDRRRRLPRFSEENFSQIVCRAGKLKPLAEARGCTVPQLALAWLHAQGDDVFPIPGSSNRLHVEENVAAYEISRALTPADLQQIEGAASVTPSAAASRDGSAPS